MLVSLSREALKRFVIFSRYYCSELSIVAIIALVMN